MVAKKKKSPKILSFEFIKKNHGDIFAFILTIIMFANYFQGFRPTFSRFIKVDYSQNVTHPDSKISVVYTKGINDGALLLSGTCLWIVILCLIDENILEKYMNRVHGSRTKKSNIRDSVLLIPYSISLLIYFSYSIITSDVLFARKSNTELLFSMSLHEKIAFLLSISHWVALIIQSYLTISPSMNLSSNAVIFSLNLMYSIMNYFYQFTTIGCVLNMLNCLHLFVSSVSSIIVSFGFSRRFNKLIDLIDIGTCSLTSISSIIINIIIIISHFKKYEEMHHNKNYIINVAASFMAVLFQVYNMASHFYGKTNKYASYVEDKQQKEPNLPKSQDSSHKKNPAKRKVQ